MFSLNYREFWASVSEWLANDLDQAAAAAQATWGHEHARDGSHAAVTATSVTTPILRLTATSYRAPNGLTAASNHVIRLAAATSLVSLSCEAGVQPGIAGIVMPGVAHGHLLYVHLQSDSSGAVFRSCTDAGYSGTRNTDGPFLFTFPTTAATEILLQTPNVLALMWIADPTSGYGTWSVVSGLPADEN